MKNEIKHEEYKDLVDMNYEDHDLGYPADYTPIDESG
jgi:hypothetical protein